jgi:hypothetical protein
VGGIRGGLLLTLALLASSAHAQTAPDTPPRSPFRIGFAAQLSLTGGDTVSRLGISAEVRRTSGPRPLATLLYLDLSQNGETGKRIKQPQLPNPSLEIQDVVGEASFLGGGFGVRYYPLAQGAGGFQPYVGAGIGVYELSTTRRIGTAPPGGDLPDNMRRIGGKLFVGADFLDFLYAEADYVNPGLNEAGGIGLTLGFRF